MGRGGRRVGAGRKKKPTDMKVLQGTFRRDRHGKEPTAPSKWPEAPGQLELTKHELELWQLFKETHGGLGVARSDFPAIYGIVAITARLLSNQRMQRSAPHAGGPLIYQQVIERVAGQDGQATEVLIVEPRENPLISQELKLFRELRAYIAITGRSPVDRARLSKDGDLPPGNPFEAFIKRR